jgi:hypothetical protein
MEETNRVAAVFVSLLLIFVALLVVLLTWQAPDQSIERIADLAGYLDDHNTAATQMLITFGALILALIGLTVIIVEIAPPETGSVKVAKVGTGEARIGTDEIARRLEDELRLVPRLRGVEARVSSRGTRADLRLDLFVDSEADVTQAANDAIQRARDIVETRMGVELEAPPRAEVHFSEESSKRVTAPAHTPSWQPTATPAAQQPSSSSGLDHEASSTVSEDRPAGA